MLSKNQVKLISSLRHKKYRDKHRLFIVEGIKGIKEFLNSGMELNILYSVEDKFDNFHQITEKELGKISQLTTPNVALALFKFPDIKEPDLSSLVLALDSLRDPGNLGTIIRLCDWFGVKDIVCSMDTVDCYNYKVVQSSMGSLARVNVHYVDLDDFLSKSDLPVFGTFMDGETIYNSTYPNNAILLMGNEANGISTELEGLIDKKIRIPRFNPNDKVESLNVATATAICLSEFRRDFIEK